MIEPPLVALVDRRVLVAEDERMIATELAEASNDTGAEARIDAAPLDANLNGEAAWPLALLHRGVSAGYAHLPRRGQPASARDLLRALARKITGVTPV